MHVTDKIAMASLCQNTVMESESGSDVVSSQKDACERTGTCFKWRPAMSKFFLRFMAEQTRQGMKVNKGFKTPAFHAAMRAIHEHFGQNVSEMNVRNHMRTFRNRWVQITKLKEKNGVIWDEKEKKIIMGEEEAMQHIQAVPKDEPYINKSIEDYEELALVCGNDRAMGKYGKQFDQPLGMNSEAPPLSSRNVEVLDFAESSRDSPSQKKSTPSSSRGGKSRRSGEKRPRDVEDAIYALAAQVGEVALALRSTKSVQFSKDLFQEVMKLVEYSAEDREAAYDYLMANDVQSRAFMAKPMDMRMRWMNKFIGNPHSGLSRS